MRSRTWSSPLAVAVSQRAERALHSFGVLDRGRDARQRGHVVEVFGGVAHVLSPKTV